MKKVTHTVWPVSYLDSNGEQTDGLWCFKTESAGKWAGEPIEITVEHPVLGDDARLAKIAELEADLAKLRAVGDVA